MRIVVAAVGRIRDRALGSLIEDYVQRIARYAKIQVVEIADGDAAEVAAKLARATPERARVIALEVAGERVTSAGLAKLVGDAQNQSVPAMVFVIGGAYGLPKETSERADRVLSLSDLTLPHRLARLVLLEQIYRAFTILRGEPYSH